MRLWKWSAARRKDGSRRKACICFSEGATKANAMARTSSSNAAGRSRPNSFAAKALGLGAGKCSNDAADDSGHDADSKVSARKSNGRAG